MHEVQYNKTHFTVSANCYMFWHQDAIFRGLITRKCKCSASHILHELLCD